MGAHRVVHLVDVFFRSRVLRLVGISAGVQSRTWLVGCFDFICDDVLLPRWRTLGDSNSQTRCEVRRPVGGCGWSIPRLGRAVVHAVRHGTLASLCRLRGVRTRLVGIRRQPGHHRGDTMVRGQAGFCTRHCVDRFVRRRHRRDPGDQVDSRLARSEGRFTMAGCNLVPRHCAGGVAVPAAVSAPTWLDARRGSRSWHGGSDAQRYACSGGSEVTILFDDRNRLHLCVWCTSWRCAAVGEDGGRAHRSHHGHTRHGGAVAVLDHCSVHRE